MKQRGDTSKAGRKKVVCDKPHVENIQMQENNAQ